VQEEIAAFDAARSADLDQPARAARIVSRAAVAEATLVEMQDCDRKIVAQLSSTWK
jgi:hypothetical protein